MRLFSGKLVLFEEREPIGKSDNFLKAGRKLKEDNDNSFDFHNYIRARMMDVFLGDWDRHDDQWRFHDEKKGKGIYYTAVPRDRDMVLNLTQGIVPTILKRFFIFPGVSGFRKNLLIGSNKYFLEAPPFVMAHPASQIGLDQWMAEATLFQKRVTDSVLLQALSRMPQPIYQDEHKELLAILKSRRKLLPDAVSRYYRYSNKVLDIRASDKNEFVRITDIKGRNALHILMMKINKHGEIEDTLMSKTYSKSITKEIRLYLSKGDDSVYVNNNTSTVRLRIIGGKGDKTYHIVNSKKRIRLYDREKENNYGNVSKLKLHIKKDSLNTAFVQTNPDNTITPMITGNINSDDGFYLGVGITYKGVRGFRKKPYSSLHKIMFSHSFSTDAFRLKIGNEWIKAVGKADVVVDADIKAPNNTQNYFGRGNETSFLKTGNYKRFYRTLFDLYELNASLRWRGLKGSSFSIGPVFQFYSFNKNDNSGRFIDQVSLLHTYDSTTLSKEKYHIGLRVQYTLDQRDNPLFPTYGAYFNVIIEGYDGLNKYSKSFVRILPQLALYKSLNTRKTIVLANRIGGGLSYGKTTFYQSLFLGENENFLGYRKYRFAGDKSIYNNLELRLALPNFGNYVLKGQIGLMAFYDVGRVWQLGLESNKWHQGVGGGIYVIPAYLAVFHLYMGHSSEGWYPYFGLGFRF